MHNRVRHVDRVNLLAANAGHPCLDSNVVYQRLALVTRSASKGRRCLSPWKRSSRASRSFLPCLEQAHTPKQASRCGSQTEAKDHVVDTTEHKRPGIVVVSPDRGIRIMLRRVLLDHGYAVEQASNGEALLRILQSSQSAQIVLVERNTLQGRLPLMPPAILYFLMGVRDLVLPVVGWSHTWHVLANSSDLLQRHAFILVTEREKALSKTIMRIIAAHHIPIIPYPLHNAQVLEAVATAQARLSP